jgi:hypothetical protein
VSFSPDDFDKKSEEKMPRFMRHVCAVEQESFFQRWAHNNSLPSIVNFRSLNEIIETKDSLALASDWEVSMSDILATIAIVINRQDQEFKDRFYKQVAQILMEKRSHIGK